MKKKRLVFFIGSMGNGGAQRVVAYITDALVKKKYEITILSYYDEEPSYYISPYVNLKSVVKENGNSVLKNINWIRRYFKKNADVIISFLAPFNIIAIISSLGIGVPIIVADRNDPRFVPENRTQRMLRNTLYEFANSVIVQTTHNRDYFSRSIKKKCDIIFNPVDLQEKKGIAVLTPKRKEIVSVGRIMPQKNHEMLIEAFSRIIATHPDYSLIIYGDCSNSIQKEKLDKLIEEKKIEQRVIMPGNVPDVIDRIAGAEVFALTSNYEGMPNALAEAMCIGLPCISTKVSGATDLITDGENGYLIESGDVDGLTQRLIELIEDKDLRKRIASEAIRLNERLHLNTITDQWNSVIGQFLR